MSERSGLGVLAEDDPPLQVQHAIEPRAGAAHVVATYSDGVAMLYIDGELADDRTIGGDLSGWTDDALVFLAGFPGPGPESQWTGEYLFVAIHSRALNPNEVRQHHDFGPG